MSRFGWGARRATSSRVVAPGGGSRMAGTILADDLRGSSGAQCGGRVAECVEEVLCAGAEAFVLFGGEPVDPVAGDALSEEAGAVLLAGLAAAGKPAEGGGLDAAIHGLGVGFAPSSRKRRESSACVSARRVS